jgi:phosphotransferase system HPr (HPr) family protein
MVYKEVTINNREGLNAAAAAAIVQVAAKFNSKILIEKGNKKINAKSIMGVLSLAVKSGDEIFIVADGKDENDALAAIENVI